MGKATTRSKKIYNKSAYNRYEITLRKDSKLNAIVERYKGIPGNSLAELIKKCLCQHFKITRNEGEDIYVEYRYGRNGEHIKNYELDKYFQGGSPQE